MASNRVAAFLCFLLLTVLGRALSIRGKPLELLKHDKRQSLQDIVTFDEHSLFINGERLFLYSGEFHPYRLPVPGLWLDVFQKIRALGYTGVSFYVDWALLEGTQGTFRSEGVFALEPFFAAAQQAGIYLLAVSVTYSMLNIAQLIDFSQRPGPYINAEVF